MSANQVTVNKIKREIRNTEQLWYYCGIGQHSTCSARYQYEADCVRTGAPVLVVQICNCKCHNRTVALPEAQPTKKENA